MAAQTVYGSNNPPGGGSAFFAGLEEIFSSPSSAAQDLASGTTGGIVGGQGGTWVPPTNAAGGAQPGAGNSFLAGLEETVNDPGQAASDAASAAAGVLPGSGTVTTWLVLAVLAIAGVAYISHKAL